MKDTCDLERKNRYYATPLLDPLFLFFFWSGSSVRYITIYVSTWLIIIITIAN